MASKNENDRLIYELKEKGHIKNEIYVKYLQKKISVRKVVESQFKHDIIEQKDIIYEIFTSWKCARGNFNSKNAVWNDIEIVTFNHLLNFNGTLTLKEICKKSRMTRRLVRDSLDGLEEEGAIRTVRIERNTILAFVNQDYILNLKNGKNR